MQEKMSQLIRAVNEIYDIQYSMALLEWDQQTNMPPGAAENRAQQLATLSRLAHQKQISDRIGSLLDALEDYRQSLPEDSDDARMLKAIRRDYEKQCKVPVTLVEEFAKLSALGQQAWERAREEDDFNSFAPLLEQLIDNRRRYAACFAPYADLYDPLLDDYEPEMTTAMVQQLFDELRPQQVALVKELTQAQPIDNSFLKRHYDDERQWQLTCDIIKQFGYDFQRGRQDRAAHPFTTTLGLGDVRITTRIDEYDLFSGLSSSMHEAGHAIYEQGIERKFDRTPLGTGTSLAIHESQSKLWENMVGRSEPFCRYLYPLAVDKFPDALQAVTVKEFYRAINRVEPSLIRVEADEATYNLHIMLRFELEVGLINGRLSVKELPELWRAKMTEYLGVTPPDDRSGVLQDVHWSCGLFGYFPTYALGNLIAAQLWQKVTATIPEMATLLAEGNFAPLREWLRHNIHRHGAKFTAAELVERATGMPMSSQPYIEYLNSKYRALYCC